MDANSTQSSGYYDLLAWLEANWKKVLIGAIGVVVVVAAIAFYKWNERQSEINANKVLLSAAPQGTNSVNADALAKVAQEHPNTSAAERAQLLAARAAFDKGDYAKAQAQFESIANGNSAAGIKAQAAFGVATALEAQKNFDQAIQKYQEVVRQYPKENVGPQAKLAIGRIYEAQGKPEEALKLYSEVQNQPDQFEFWQGDAAERKDRLVARHPNLKEEASVVSEQIIEVTTPPAPGTTNK